jgi:hypothetical protein
MKKLILLHICSLYISYSIVIAQDTVDFKFDSKVVLDHFSEQFPNGKVAISMSSYYDENNYCYFNIYIFYELSDAIVLQPLSYFIYDNLLLLSRNNLLFINHSKEYLVQYINTLKEYVISDIIIDSICPLKYHWVNPNEEFVLDEKFLYYCYKVRYGEIITFTKTYDPYKLPCNELRIYN